MNQNRIRIGAINWDAALPIDTYFGGFSLRNLGADKHRSRLPFFTKEKDGKFEISYRMKIFSRCKSCHFMVLYSNKSASAHTILS